MNLSRTNFCLDQYQPYFTLCTARMLLHRKSLREHSAFCWSKYHKPRGSSPWLPRQWSYQISKAAKIAYTKMYTYFLRPQELARQ